MTKHERLVQVLTEGQDAQSRVKDPAPPLAPGDWMQAVQKHYAQSKPAAHPLPAARKTMTFQAHGAPVEVPKGAHVRLIRALRS